VKRFRLVAVLASVLLSGEIGSSVAFAQDSPAKLFRDVATDYRSFVSKNTGRLLTVGGSGATSIRVANGRLTALGPRFVHRASPQVSTGQATWSSAARSEWRALGQ
jgi:hypothetical protein